MLSAAVRGRDQAAAAVVGGVSVVALAAGGASGSARWPGVGACLAVCVLLFLLLVPSVQARAREIVSVRPALALGAIGALAVYGMAVTLSLGTATAVSVLAWPLCFGAAVAATGWRDRGKLSPHRLLGAGLALALLAGTWDRAIQIAVPGGARLGLPYLSSVALALFLLCVVRPQRSFDVRFGLPARDWAVAAAAVAGLAAVAIPAGFAVGFLHWEPRWMGFGYAAARLFGLVVFVGLPEELLFRGVFQEALARIWTPRIGWLAGSLLFGMAHLFRHFPPPNWELAVAATLAGLAYGWVYLRTGRIAAAAVTHGLVNWLWSTWLGS